MTASPLSSSLLNGKMRWADMDDDDCDASDGFPFISNPSFVSPTPPSRIGLPISSNHNNNNTPSPSYSSNENTPPPSSTPSTNSSSGMIGFSSIIKQWSDIVAPRKSDSSSSSFSSSSSSSLSSINNYTPYHMERIPDSELDSSRDGLPLMLKQSSFPSTMQTIDENSNDSMMDQEWQKVTAGKKRNLGQNIGKQEQSANEPSFSKAITAGSLNHHTPPSMAKPQARQPRIIKKTGMIIQSTNTSPSTPSSDRSKVPVSAPTGWTRQKSTELIREIKGEPASSSSSSSSSSVASSTSVPSSSEPPSTPNQGGKKKQKLNGGHYRNVTPANTPSNTPRAQRTHSGVWGNNNNHNNNNQNNNGKFAVRLLTEPVPISLPESIRDTPQRSASISSDIMEPSTPILNSRSMPISDLTSSSAFNSAILAAASTPTASETTPLPDASTTTTDGTSTSVDGGKAKVVPRVLTWEERLKQRQKQIDIGKRTEGYRHYLAAVPKNRRQPGQPRTPNIHKQCSKRSWDGQVRKWRRQLHLWDPQSSSTPDNDNKSLDDSIDGAEGEEREGSEEYLDVENELKAMAEEEALDIQVQQVLEAEKDDATPPLLHHTISTVQHHNMDLPDDHQDTPVLIRSVAN